MDKAFLEELICPPPMHGGEYPANSFNAAANSIYIIGYILTDIF
jgi:hypothetical protein